MKKTGRNDPCPCGSGKKYKHCCLDKDNKVVPFPADKRFDDNLKRYQDTVENWDFSKNGPAPTFNEFMGSPNAATSVIRDMGQSIMDSGLSSIDELNAHARSYMNKANSAPCEEFLGLSPEIMNRMLNSEFGDSPGILDINIMVNPALADGTPALRQCRYLLEKIGKEEKGVKATPKGNLPRDMVREFYDLFIRGNAFYPSTPSGEDDVKDIKKAKFFLRDSGYIKFRLGRYSITKKGGELLENFYPGALYHAILMYFIKKYNWLYMTRYQEVMEFVQVSAPFCFYILKCKADEYVQGEVLGGIYSRAFPTLAENYHSSYGNNMVVSGFTYIFLQEIAHYLGLLDLRGDRKMMSEELEYRTTDLFRELFQWKV